jgi:hypothetical protein
MAAIIARHAVAASSPASGEDLRELDGRTADRTRRRPAASGPREVEKPAGAVRPVSFSAGITDKTRSCRSLA